MRFQNPPHHFGGYTRKEGRVLRSWPGLFGEESRSGFQEAIIDFEEFEVIIELVFDLAAKLETEALLPEPRTEFLRVKAMAGDVQGSDEFKEVEMIARMQ